MLPMRAAVTKLSPVGEGRQLELFKVAAEALIVGKGQDSGVIGKIGGQNTDDAGAGQSVYRLHKRREHLVDDRNDAKLDKEGGYRTGKDGNGHDIENSIKQQLIGRVHHCVEHIYNAHLTSYEGEEPDEQGKEDKALAAYILFDRGAFRLSGVGLFLFHVDSLRNVCNNMPQTATMPL